MPKLTHVRLFVNDFPTCFRYRDTIGLQPTFGDESDVYADFDAGETAIALFSRPIMAEAIGRPIGPPANGLGPISLILAVDDVDAESKRLESAGVEIVAGAADRPDWGIRTAHLLDPAGNLVDLQSSSGVAARHRGVQSPDGRPPISRRSHQPRRLRASISFGICSGFTVSCGTISRSHGGWRERFSTGGIRRAFGRSLPGCNRRAPLWQLKVNCIYYCRLVHAHHNGEDTAYLPGAAPLVAGDGAGGRSSRGRS